MLMTICILIGTALVVCAILISCVTKKKRTVDHNTIQPQRTSNTNGSIQSMVSGRARAGTGGASTLRRSPSVRRPLPPRRISDHAGVSGNQRGTGYGPRGIKPSQFPCCPFDKQRNTPGGRQIIFWDNAANCYRCSHGHRFKANGRLF